LVYLPVIILNLSAKLIVTCVTPEYMNAALSTGKKKQVAVIVPADFIHFKLELFLGPGFMSLYIYKCHKILLVANGDRVTIRRPADVNVLPYNQHSSMHSWKKVFWG